MRNRVLTFVAAALAFALPVLAQSSPQPSPQPQPAASPSPWPLPPALEKELAAKASKVTEVTLDKNMLGFAGSVMDNHDSNQSTARQFIGGLDGIYVRHYEFDKEGQYSMDDVEKLRQAFETSEWTPIVRASERGGMKVSDVFVKQVNGETRGMFVLSAEPRELSIVLILGPIQMNHLGMLRRFGAGDSLDYLQKVPKVDKKSKEGGNQ